MIESFRRNLKHQWLFINTLDNVTTLRRLVTFYVNVHSKEILHSAFNGQTPDEMHHGTGDKIPQVLKEKRDAARLARMEANRAMTCDASLNRKEAAVKKTTNAVAVLSFRSERLYFGFRFDGVTSNPKVAFRK